MQLRGLVITATLCKHNQLFINWPTYPKSHRYDGSLKGHRFPQENYLGMPERDFLQAG